MSPNQGFPPVPEVPPKHLLDQFESLPPDMFSPYGQYKRNIDAQRQVLKSWQAQDPKEKFRLCLKALEAFPFSVDAYNCIADTYRRMVNDLPNAEVNYLRAEKCAHILWPSTAHEEEEEEISWRSLEHRPYLRMLHGLGLVYEEQGRLQQAIEKYRYLLRVDTNDNQDARILLLCALLGEGEYQEAEAIAAKFSGGRKTHECDFAYGHVLIDFIKFQQGMQDETVMKESFVRALRINSIVPLLLLQDIPLPPRPALIPPGSIEQAAAHVHMAKRAWERNPSALAWLRTLRFEGGPKPQDDGSTLFHLLAKDYLVIKLGKNGHEVATTNVCRLPARGAETFSLPAGMKIHNPQKIVCCASKQQILGADMHDDACFINFGHADADEVPFWKLLSESPAFGVEAEEHFCDQCFQPAKKVCSKCRITWYCSFDCQKKHWKKSDSRHFPPHKVMCAKFIKT